ncbi:MAG: ThuA domain-containing protein [Pirellulales bacterium]|nr:ThuA domain-containing protein [Pirellulales bacterium]
MNPFLSLPRCIGCLLIALAATQGMAKDLDVLFLGDRGHHQPRARFEQLQPVLARRGIRMDYTEAMADLNADKLNRYDALVLYANIDRIDPPQEKALLDYVAGGGGFVPLHCATYCFRNSSEVVALIGAQFKSHGTGVFRTSIAQPDHTIMRGFGGFESWDESYVHHLHNEKDRTVLSYRIDAAGREPWTWVRTHGQGRVFYTAWGHDHRTWSNAGFQNLVERGIRWAAGDDVAQVPDYLAGQPFPVPEMNPPRRDVAEFEYLDVGGKIPNYTPGKQWGTQGDALTKMQQPLPAEESLKHIVVPRGFRVELFASDPDIGGKPIAMAWDQRGRLWIAETYDYPNELQPPGKGRDRIRILEDTDGDWRADKFTVFAEGLSIPTSIAFYRGGAIVHDGTRTLYLKDTDGDDVADEKSVLFSGWNQGDTHGGVSNFQYGLDNWIWAMQGYNNSTPVANGKQQQTFRQGFFRFRPDGSEIEFIRSTNNNTWGLGISEEGLIFGSTANRNPSVYMPIANRYYERVRGWAPSLRLGTIADTHLFKPITEKIRQVDQHGGYTAAAGHALYTARVYPREYWNRTAFVAGPTGHLVGTFVLQPNGSDFRSTSPFNLFASDDEWTAPIMAEVGPDGNVWVIDWYNYIVQHNPTPRGFKTGKGNAYETDLRDKKHGRIYRVVHDAAGSNQPFSLAGASTSQLVSALKHPTMLWRKHAQRLLVEQGGQAAVQELLRLANDRSVDEIGLNVGAIHALWTLHGLGQLDGSNDQATAAAVHALTHPSAGVRRNALQVLPDQPASTRAVLAANLLHDENAQVRLAAMLALADLPASDDAGAAILTALLRDADGDRWLQDASVSAAASNANSFLAAIAQSKAAPTGRKLETMRIVANHYGRTGPVETVGGVIAQLTQAHPDVADSILTGLADGWPSDRKPPLDRALEGNLKELINTLPRRSGGLLVKLARDWGSKQFEDYASQVSQSMLEELDDPQASVSDRQAAAKQLVEFRSRDDEVVAELLDRVTPQTEPQIALGIVRAIGFSESPAAGQLLVERFGNLTPQTRQAGIGVLLSRPKSTQTLLNAIQRGDVLLAELSLDQKQALMAHPSESIKRLARGLLNRGGALPNADRQAVLQSMMAATEQSGDVAAGKAVFKKNCANCHIHGGQGQRVGPDLTGMAVHPKSELLTHILDPSRDVEGNYRVYTVLTLDGVIVNGLLASESKTAIEMFDAEGKKQVILREDIDQLRASSKSLMPEGFEKQIPVGDMTNLLEFLTDRGRFLPIDMSKVATIASDRGMFFTRESSVERMIFPDWQPKTFHKVTFQLTDPRDGKVPNIILLHGPNGAISRQMPQAVTVPCNGSARTIHLLSGVSGWGFPAIGQKSVSMIVRIHYADGQTEDHRLLNGEHFADYIRRVDVPQSQFAFALRGQQIRYLAIHPRRADPIGEIEFVKGPDRSAPIVMAITLETAASGH